MRCLKDSPRTRQFVLWRGCDGDVVEIAPHKVYFE